MISRMMPARLEAILHFGKTLHRIHGYSFVGYLLFAVQNFNFDNNIST